MVKLEQALILDPPSELHFKAPFKELTTSFLKLTNPTDQYICFKLKTTAPKTYCVRPNSGIIPPKESVSVAVMLQPIDLDSADKSKHKFMVQSMFAPHGDVNLEALWKDTPAENFMNSKLRCVFDISEQNSQVAVDGDDVKQETVSVSEISAEVCMSPAKDTHTNADMEKLEEDNKLLKTVLMKVRQENSQLKEECLRWRVSRGSGVSESQTHISSGRPTVLSSHSALSSQNHFGMKNIITMGIVLIVGIYLGQYF